MTPRTDTETEEIDHDRLVAELKRKAERYKEMAKEANDEGHTRYLRGRYYAYADMLDWVRLETGYYHR